MTACDSVESYERRPWSRGSALRHAAYPLDADDNASNRTVLRDYLPEDGPDGLVFDSEGNLWVAVRDATRPGIYPYTADGEEKCIMPTTIPTNVHFDRGRVTPSANAVVLIFLTLDAADPSIKAYSVDYS